MDYLFSLLLSYLLLYRYAVIALVSFLSGLALPLPANTLLLAAGAFSSQGFMDAPVVFFVALVSNVLGDSVGWALTRFWGTKVITETHMNRFSSVRRKIGRAQV